MAFQPRFAAGAAGDVAPVASPMNRSWASPFLKTPGMTITIPEAAIEKTGFTEERIKLDVALVLFHLDVLTLAQAAGVAGLHRRQFQEELAKRKIPIDYGGEEREEDPQTLNISFE